MRDELVQDRLRWEKKTWALEPEECPLQRDGHNCGPYVLWWAKQIVEGHGRDVTAPGDSWRQEIMQMLESVPRKGRDDPPDTGGDDDLVML